MRYLLSEVDFYLPTVEEYKSHVVVIRRDQLEGEKLFIAPRDLVFASASFGSSENKYNVIDNFADLIIFSAQDEHTFSINFDSSSESTLRIYDGETRTVATLCMVDGKYIILTPKHTDIIELVKKFIVENLGSEAFIIESEPEVELETKETPAVSEVEKNALIDDAQNESTEGDVE